MEELFPSYASNSTVKDIDKIADADAIGMHAFKRIIEACREDPKIVLSVSESLDCLIRDINA